VKFAKYLFYFAGGYGVLILPPMYFLEQRIGRESPPPITHPEYFYGFIGVALACQVMFLIIGSDPVRYRPLMLAGVIEKLSFVIPVSILYQTSRVSNQLFLAAMFDLTLGVLFLVAFFKVGSGEQAQAASQR
jgi:hypothetical protein